MCRCAFGQLDKTYTILIIQNSDFKEISRAHKMYTHNFSICKFQIFFVNIYQEQTLQSQPFYSNINWNTILNFHILDFLKQGQNLLNLFIPNVRFLYLLKTSEKPTVLCFQGVEKGYIKKKWVNLRYNRVKYCKTKRKQHSNFLVPRFH